MKMMMNGAVTLGTLDGANIEIVNEAGKENNYIFGATVEDINDIEASYNPKKLYSENPKIKAVLDTLIDGTFDDGGTGVFKEIYDSLIVGSKFEKADKYYLLLDFMPLYEERLRLNKESANRKEFAKKGFANIAGSGKFSSDRTIAEYASDIWHISEVK